MAFLLRRLESRHLFGRRFGLVLFLPLGEGLAIDEFARLVLRDRDALFFRRFAVPVRKAVAAEPCKDHEIDVLHVGAFAQMTGETAKRRLPRVRSAFACSCLPPFASGGYGERGSACDPEMPDFTDAGERRGGKEMAGIARRPLALPLRRLDQVLPDLDQDVRQAMHGAVTVEAVVPEAPYRARCRRR